MAGVQQSVRSPVRKQLETTGSGSRRSSPSAEVTFQEFFLPHLKPLADVILKVCVFFPCFQQAIKLAQKTQEADVGHSGNEEVCSAGEV